MMRLILAAYDDPARRELFYSANGAETGSERLNRAAGWDWTPQPSRGVGGASTCMFALAMGCPPRATSEGKEWVAPRITDPAQVRDLPVPDVREGRTGQVLRDLAAAAAQLAPGERLREPDIQSPFGVAELMWGQPFYVALLEHPREVHELLEKITAFIISFIREVRRVAGERLNAAGFPLIWADEHGTMLSDDSMSLLSPAMHREFSLPYVNRIAEACGPLFYHSCTWRRQYFPNLHDVQNVRAYNWNPGNSDDPAVIIREFSGRAVLAPHLVAEMHRDRDATSWGRTFADELDLLRYMVDAMTDRTAMYFWFSNVVRKGPVIERIHDWLDAEGFTPRARGLA